MSLTHVFKCRMTEGPYIRLQRAGVSFCSTWLNTFPPYWDFCGSDFLLIKWFHMSWKFLVPDFQLLWNNFNCVCCRSMMRCIFSRLSDKTLPVWPPNCKIMDIVSHLHHSLFLKVMLNSRCILDDKFGKLADSEFVLIIHG